MTDPAAAAAPKIERALISVSDKTGLVDFARALAERGVEILSTGGTAKALKDAGIAVKDVAEHTGFPEMMDGRLKTLHPKVHGGLLAVRGNAEHAAAAQAHGIAPIDLLVVNLYPFEATVAKGAPYDECIENIDIGGPAMIRAAAKNHAAVTVVVDPEDYATGPGRDGAARRRHQPGAAQGAGGQGLRAHRRLRRGDRQTGSPRRWASARRAGARSPAASPRSCATARTRTSGRPSTCRASAARAWRRPCSTRARSCPTTTSATPTRPSSWWPSSIRRSRRPSPSSSTPTRAASRSAPRWPRPTPRRCAAIPSAPSAASSRSTARSTRRRPARSPASSPRW